MAIIFFQKFLIFIKSLLLIIFKEKQKLFEVNLLLVKIMFKFIMNSFIIIILLFYLIN